MYDILIIGAGITGAFLARGLAQYDLGIALLDKEDDVACGATMANSAIIHSGHDPKPGTLKARFNVRGNELYEGVCRELGAAFSRCSALVAAASPEEEAVLYMLQKQAAGRGVPARRLSREEALAPGRFRHGSARASEHRDHHALGGCDRPCGGSRFKRGGALPLPPGGSHRGGPCRRRAKRPRLSGR